MSFRIEEKLSIDRYNIVNFKKQLEDKNIKQIYKRRKIHSVYFEITIMKCLPTQLKD